MQGYGSELDLSAYKYVLGFTSSVQADAFGNKTLLQDLRKLSKY